MRTLDLVAAEPDLTLEEIRARLATHKKLTVGITLDLAIFRPPRDHLQKNSAHKPSKIGLTLSQHARH